MLTSVVLWRMRKREKRGHYFLKLPENGRGYEREGVKKHEYISSGQLMAGYRYRVHFSSIVIRCLPK